MAILELADAKNRRSPHPSTGVGTEQNEHHPSVMSSEQAWVASIREEIDGYLVGLRQLNRLNPDEVFGWLSGVTARLAEIRVHCVRVESRRITALRTREIDPIIDECERQYRLHSRIAAVRQAEYDQTKHIT